MVEVRRVSDSVMTVVLIFEEERLSLIVCLAKWRKIGRKTISL